MIRYIFESLAHFFGLINIWPAPIITKRMSDAEAMASDWRAVGKDMEAAIKRYENDRRPL